jgi:hypothetical protein
VLLAGAASLAPALFLGCRGPLPSVSPPARGAATGARGADPLAAGYAGSQACAPCHPGLAATHARTVHARTLRAVGKRETDRFFRTRQTVSDAEAGAVYSVAVRAGRPLFRVARLDGGSEEGEPRYVFGSGKRGYTFLIERAGQFVESRLSYYPAIRRWSWTPGQQTLPPGETALGRPQDDASAAACFGCHSTTVAREGARPKPERSRFDVGCERCHGPGRDHVATARAGQPPARLESFAAAPAARVVELCGECHRAPRPLTPPEMAALPNLARFAATGFAASRCYTESAGQLSCIACHDPHAPVATGARAYEKVCLSCHGAPVPRAAACPVNPRAGCIGCHMPKQPAGFPTATTFRNHWIRKHAPGRRQAE